MKRTICILAFLLACGPLPNDTDACDGTTANVITASPTESCDPSATSSDGTSEGDATTGSTCPACPDTLTRCEALDLACTPLGIGEVDCVALHALCVGGAAEDDLCPAVAKVGGAAGAQVCTCAFQC